jgi:hypothetical protein
MVTQEAFQIPAARPLAHVSNTTPPEGLRPPALGRATSLLPVAGMLSGAVLLASSQAGARRFGVTALGASLGLALARWQWGRAFNWQPPYRVELEHGRLEIRRYGREAHAETTVEAASWNDTLEHGFNILAGYISGGNAAGVKLPMTSPVLTTVNEPASRRSRSKGWKAPTVCAVDALTGRASRTMAFVMPGQLTLDELPAPTDERVQLRVVPPRRVAALTFHGRYGGELPAQKRNELLFLAKCAGLSITSEVVFAGYDAPFTLPLLRRNEVLVEIEG